MILLPITDRENDQLSRYAHADCQEVLTMFPEYYKEMGFTPPWIGYLVLSGNDVVGSCGFKGRPYLGKVEIGYWIFKEFRGRGIGTSSCGKLVDLALEANPSVVISARTASLDNESSKILRKNGFLHNGKVYDDESGDNYEWIFKG